MPDNLDAARVMLTPNSPALAAFEHIIAQAQAVGFRFVLRTGEVRSVELQWPDRKRNPFSVQTQANHLNFYLRRPILKKHPDLFKMAEAKFGPVKANKRGEYRTHLHNVKEVDAVLAFLRQHGAWPSKTVGLRPPTTETFKQNGGEPFYPAFISDEDRSWAEGAPRLLTHLRRERGAGLADAKRSHFRAVHGHLFCERCHMDPIKTFGSDFGEACIEIHHCDTPVAEMHAEHETRLEDLQCLCANCHRVVHRELRAGMPGRCN